MIKYNQKIKNEQLLPPLNNDSNVQMGDTFNVRNKRTGETLTLTAGKMRDQNVDHWLLSDKKMNNVFEMDDVDQVDRNNHAFSTKLTTKAIEAKLNMENPKFEFKAANIHEDRLRNKYPDYPFKRIKSLTNSNNRKNMNYEIVEGEIIEPRLKKQLNTPTAYYQKALKTFNINIGKADNEFSPVIPINQTVEKGTISGPMVLSKKPETAKRQVKSMREMANSRYKVDPRSQDFKAKQQFWLDKNSNMQGDWHIPFQGLVLNSELNANDFKTCKSNPGKGLQIQNSLIKNSAINSNDKPVWLIESNLNNCNLYANSVQKLAIMRKVNLKNVDLNPDQLHLETSEITNAVLTGDNNIKYTSIGSDNGEKTMINNSQLDTVIDHHNDNNFDSVKLTQKDFDLPNTIPTRGIDQEVKGMDDDNVTYHIDDSPDF